HYVLPILHGPAHAHGDQRGGQGERLDQLTTFHVAISPFTKGVVRCWQSSGGGRRHPCAARARCRALCSMCRVILRTSALLSSMCVLSRRCASSVRRDRIAPRIRACSS